MARSIITITEAKTISLQDLDMRSSYNPEIQATGTGTDNIIVVSGFGPKITYVGGHAKAGEIIAKTVTSAVKEAILKQEKLKRDNRGANEL
jgi:adenosylcobinamide amidohydrolase